MSTPHEYILGADAVELARLRFQHKVWVREMYAFLKHAGLRAGRSVLDLGAGPGYTTLELATIVGPEGRVAAVDESEGFLEYLRAECDRYELRNVAIVQSRIESLDLEPDSFDFAYARWLYCWLEDPVDALRHTATFVRPGGALLLQEYIHWGAMRIIPDDPVVTAAIAACRKSWDVGRADMDIARRFPEIAPSIGLELESFEPVARMGRVGSLEWQWVGTFLRDYLPKLIKRGLFAEEDYPRFLEHWRGLEERGASYIFGPLMSEAVLRKPG